jgi:hypothetical protein
VCVSVYVQAIGVCLSLCVYVQANKLNKSITPTILITLTNFITLVTLITLVTPVTTINRAEDVPAPRDDHDWKTDTILTFREPAVR